MGESSKDIQGVSGWKPSFNGAVHCPWASSAPISATTSCKNSGKCSESCHAPPNNFSEQQIGNLKVNPWTSRNKPTITYFNNFVRLMQLFPEMHPASLHTAMSMCKNEFISTVDRLLYVRRYRNGAFYRKENQISNQSKKVHRKVPHYNGFKGVNPLGNEEKSSSTVENPEGGDLDGLVSNRSFEVKRLVYNNKAKIRCGKTEVEKMQEDQVASAQDLSQAKCC